MIRLLLLIQAWASTLFKIKPIVTDSVRFDEHRHGPATSLLTKQ
jgi:hypothetical protein